MPATLSIISNVFDPRERGRAIGVWAGAVGLAVAIGPIVGGAAAGALLVGLGLPDQRADRDRRHGRGRCCWCRSRATRAPAASTSSACCCPSSAWSRWCTASSTAASTASAGRRSWALDRSPASAVLAAFVWYERRIDAPVAGRPAVPQPARSRPRSPSIGLVFFAAMGTFFFMTFYLQLVRGYSPLQTGLLLLPFAVGAAGLRAAQRRDGQAVRRRRRSSAVGLALVAVVAGRRSCSSTRTPRSGSSARSFFVQGAGMANVMPPATESIMSALPREKAGVGSAVSNTVRQVGRRAGRRGARLGRSPSVYRDQIADAAAGAARAGPRTRPTSRSPARTASPSGSAPPARR